MTDPEANTPAFVDELQLLRGGCEEGGTVFLQPGSSREPTSQHLVLPLRGARHQSLCGPPRAIAGQPGNGNGRTPRRCPSGKLALLFELFEKPTTKEQQPELFKLNSLSINRGIAGIT